MIGKGYHISIFKFKIFNKNFIIFFYYDNGSKLDHILEYFFTDPNLKATLLINIDKV